MKLYILAAGKDAKGTQLEYLVKTILESLGNEYVSTNVIGAGGDEIDVIARIVLPSIKGSQEYPLICECKAHESPINMSDWDKFLGKVFRHQKNNPQTRGLMIALSDANGSVKGDIETIKYQDVQLLQGNDLIKPLSKAFSLEEEKIAREKVSHLTKETIVSIDLILYEKEIYWLFTFASGDFSIFNKKYQSLTSEQESSILPLLAQFSPHNASKYKNVRHEFDLIHRRIFVRSVICWHLMKGKMTFQDAISDVNYMTQGEVSPEMKDVEEVAQNIPFAIVDLINQTIELKNEDQIDFVVFYRFLLDGPLPIFLFNDYYKQHIDEKLLNAICAIQSGIALDENDKRTCLFILRHSHSALHYALHPDVTIGASVVMDLGSNRKSARNHFVERLLSWLEIDVKSAGGVISFKELGLRGYDKTITVSVLSSNGERREISTTQKLFCFPQKENDRWIMVETVDGFDGYFDTQQEKLVFNKED